MNSHNIKQPPMSVFLAAVVVIFLGSLSAATSVGFVPYYVDGVRPESHLVAISEPLGESPETVALSELPQLGIEELLVLARGLTLSPDALPEGSVPLQTVLPKRIVIPQIGMDLSVQNPETRDIGLLDTLLQSGPARFMDSARLGGRGNVLIFAHSSNVPVVRNQMYKAFNRIPELSVGNVITLVGDDGVEYLYRVRSVQQVNA